MTVKLNEKAYKQAKKLIELQKVVLDEKSKWHKHQPSVLQKNKYLEEHGFSEYEKWFLGIDEMKKEGTKGRYKFPYGDFQSIHRCGVLSVEARAGQYKYFDIEVAAAHLHGMLDQLM